MPYLNSLLFYFFSCNNASVGCMKEYLIPKDQSLLAAWDSIEQCVCEIVDIKAREVIGSTTKVLLSSLAYVCVCL